MAAGGSLRGGTASATRRSATVGSSASGNRGERTARATHEAVASSSARTQCVSATRGTQRAITRPGSWTKTIAALVVAGAWAQEPNAPTQPAFVLPPPPQYRLEPVPQVALDGKAFAASQEETAEVRALVASLTGIDRPDFGLAPWMPGLFAPVKPWPRPDWLVTPIAVERLVALGPSPAYRR